MVSATDTADARRVDTSTRRALGWASSAAIGRQLVQAVGTVVLARLLTPGDYGLAAVVLSINGFAAIFTELGLGPAIVQCAHLTHSRVATAVWMNFLSGLLLTSGFAVLAAPLAGVFDQAALIPLVRVGSLQFVLAMQVIPLALLERQFNFRTIGIIEPVAAMCGLAAAIGTAMIGGGPYSLVIGPIASTIALTVLAWRMSPAIPLRTPTRDDAVALWRYSRGIVGFTSANYWSRNVDNLLLAKFATASALGLYSRAYALMLLPISQVSSVLARVLLPRLSLMRGDSDKLRATWLTSVKMSWTLGLPVAIGIAICAPSLVPILLGEGWAETAPLLQILALSVPPQLIGRTQGAVFQALGRTALQFRISLLTNLLMIAAVGVGVIWGARGVAIAVCAAMYIATAISGRHVLSLLGATVVDLSNRLWPAAIAGTALALVALLPMMTGPQDLSRYATLALQIVGGSATYVLTLWHCDRSTLRRLLPRRNRPVVSSCRSRT